ncbi:MAG: ribosome silencing factor [Leptospiraceae bacterium]|nr:ribosome silencing factor [Leptospiraceae bacterium]
MKLSLENEKPAKKAKKKTSTTDLKKVLKIIQTILNEKKCKEISFLNLEKIHSYLSVFVICTVDSHVQARAVSRELERNLKEFKLGKGNQEKKSQDNGWILLDMGEIIIHIMTEEKRNFYGLERLWGDAKQIKV